MRRGLVLLPLPPVVASGMHGIKGIIIFLAASTFLLIFVSFPAAGDMKKKLPFFLDMPTRSCSSTSCEGDEMNAYSKVSTAFYVRAN